MKVAAEIITVLLFAAASFIAWLGAQIFSRNAAVSIGVVLVAAAAFILFKWRGQLEKIKLIVLGIGIGIVISILCFLSSIEAYWPFDPHIDTQFAKNFNRDAFTKIQLGASMSEVELALRAPLWKEGCGGCWETEFYTRDNTVSLPQSRNCTTSCDAARQLWQYSDDGACSWWDFAWEYYAIDFFEGKVVAKDLFWRGD
jgi:hypothetical protein